MQKTPKRARTYLTRYHEERKRLERKAMLVNETPSGAWRLYAEWKSRRDNWDGFVAIRSTPPISMGDKAVFRLAHNGRRWQSHPSLRLLTALHSDMLTTWDVQVCAMTSSFAPGSCPET